MYIFYLTYVIVCVIRNHSLTKSKGDVMVQVSLEQIRVSELNVRKKSKNFRLMCAHVILAVLVIIFAMCLHHIEKAYDRSVLNLNDGKMTLLGIRGVPGAFVYYLVLGLLTVSQLGVIVLIWCVQNKKSFIFKNR